MKITLNLPDSTSALGLFVNIKAPNNTIQTHNLLIGKNDCGSGYQLSDGEEIAIRMAADIDLKTPIADCRFSTRAYNCMYRAGIRTVGDFTNRTEFELKHIRNLGKKSFNEIKLYLFDHGLAFAKSEEDN